MARSVTDVYEFEEIIGEGASSNVVLATHNETGLQYAIKIIDKEKIKSEVQRERVDREISILKRCNHPNIIKLVETYESDLEICMVMELMSGGDLFDRITSKGSFTEDEARTAMYNIVSAVDYLHDRGIVHRDLKPENLLYNSKEGAATLRIGDFGLAKYTSDSEGLVTPCGTIAYTAPEVTSNKLYREVVDIWSCGCILYFMLFGRPPFYSADEEEIYDLVSEGSFDFPDEPSVSSSAKELIGFLLEKDPSKRYSTKQVLLHPWMTGQSKRPRTFCDAPPQKPKPLSSSNSSMPLPINNLRVSFNSAIDAQRGPLTPPLASPLESPLWKKRLARARAAGSPSALAMKLSDGDEPDLSSDSDNNEEIDRNLDLDLDDDEDNDGDETGDVDMMFAADDEMEEDRIVI